MLVFLSQRDCRPFVPALPAGTPLKTRTACRFNLFHKLIPTARSASVDRPLTLLPSGDSYVSLPSSSGTLRVSVAEWIDLAAAAAPDVIFMLSDEISSVSTGGGSRTQKSIDRSGRWFLQQLAALRAHPSLQARPAYAVKYDSNSRFYSRFYLQHTAVFAAVQGGNSLGNRARACASISAMKVTHFPCYVLAFGFNVSSHPPGRSTVWCWAV